MSDTYKGEPIDASWNSDLKDVNQTVDVVESDGDGKESTDAWPSALPKQPFKQGTSNGKSIQMQIVETLSLQPELDNGQVKDIVDCSSSHVGQVRSKVSVFVEPSEVPFSIPDEPVKGCKLADHALKDEKARFSENSVNQIHRTENLPIQEIGHRHYKLGEETESIAADLGESVNRVRGSLSQYEGEKKISESINLSEGAEEFLQTSPRGKLVLQGPKERDELQNEGGARQNQINTAGSASGGGSIIATLKHAIFGRGSSE